jgi:hypothetical protein
VIVSLDRQTICAVTSPMCVSESMGVLMAWITVVDV